MGKSILVMDTPESCAECPCFLETATDCCGVNGKDIESHNKPDWCPLRDAPEKKAKNSYHNQHESGYVDGWNDCIDKILKGG